MKPQEQKPQTKTKNLLEIVSQEELKKVEAHKAKTKGALPVDDFWLILAEFGRVYGWEAYKAARDDEIGLEEMMTLVEANRKIEHLDLYKNSLASFIGSGSAQTKRPSSTFKKLTNKFINKAKADE